MVEDPYKDLRVTTGVVTRPRTTLVNKTGGWREFRPIIDHDECVGCGTCEKYCPDMAMKEVEDGRFEVDLDYCKGCGICAEECPVDAIEMEREVK